MLKIIKVFIITIVSITVFLFTIGTILPPYANRSAVENRTYAKLDTSIFTLENIKNGQLFKNLNEIFEDQFFKRESFVEVYSWVQYKLGKKKINDRIIGEDGYTFIIDVPDVLNEYIDNLNALGNYCYEKDVELFFSLTPAKDLVLIDKIPKYFRKDSSYVFGLLSDGLSDKVHYISLYEQLKEAQEHEPQYYFTDHHWNTNGVFTAYNEIINRINSVIPEIGKPHPKSEFIFEKNEDVFIGSSGRVLTAGVINKYDDIDLYYPTFQSDLHAETAHNSDYPIYHMDCISDELYNNDYGVYLGGAELDITIHNNLSQNDKKAIIVGISYAPPISILLAEHFKETNYIDLRYTEHNSLYQLIEEKEPDAVIFIYYSGVFNDVLYTFNNNK
jgi:hypothetical protein